MNYLRKIGAGLFAAALFLGWQFLKKNKNAEDYKKQLIEICEQDKECLEAVNQNFTYCYDTHYSLGSKRKASGLKIEEFTNCINKKSGHMYFYVKNAEEDSN